MVTIPRLRGLPDSAKSPPPHGREHAINGPFKDRCYFFSCWGDCQIDADRAGLPSFQPAGKQAGVAMFACAGAEAMAVDLSMSVLVVDDYNTMIRIIRNLLKQIGFQDVDDAADGTAALGKMREKRYGLVISDWNMEPMTGYELLKKVRGDPSLSKTPFIMVT